MGQAPNGQSYNERGEGLPLIAGAGDFNGLRISPKKFTTAPGKVSEPGDIILSIRASIGAKVWSDGEYCLGRGVAGLRPRPHSTPATCGIGSPTWSEHSQRRDVARHSFK
jgi:type I restriction enzyme S subunit